MKNDSQLSAFAVRERPCIKLRTKPPSPQFDWTDERVEITKTLWKEGKSASQIAKYLGGPTRNAVIGKMHRLGLSGRATTSRTKSHTPRRHPPYTSKALAAGAGKKWAARLRAVLKPRPGKFSTITQLPVHSTKPPRAPVALPLPHADDVARISYAAFIDPLAEVAIPRDACRWPVGEPMTGFCGCTAAPGSSYCSGHLARSVVNVQVTPRPYQTTALSVRSIKDVEGFLA